jgi:hypothetical protein
MIRSAIALSGVLICGLGFASEGDAQPRAEPVLRMVEVDGHDMRTGIGTHDSGDGRAVRRVRPGRPG